LAPPLHRLRTGDRLLRGLVNPHPEPDRIERGHHERATAAARRARKKTVVIADA
jgi:hypothetical protein